MEVEVRDAPNPSALTKYWAARTTTHTKPFGRPALIVVEVDGGLAAVMAAFATLAALLVSTDVSKQQNELANDEGLEVADAFVKAQRRVTLQRNILLVLPCAAALVFRPGSPTHS